MQLKTGRLSSQESTYGFEDFLKCSNLIKQQGSPKLRPAKNKKKIGTHFVHVSIGLR